MYTTFVRMAGTGDVMSCHGATLHYAECMDAWKAWRMQQPHADLPF